MVSTCGFGAWDFTFPLVLASSLPGNKCGAPHGFGQPLSARLIVFEALSIYD